MDVKIVKHKMYEETPSYAKNGDAGIDLIAVEIIKETSEQIVYNTGISLEIPKGFVGMIFPRSSIRNKNLILSNSVGVVDSGYRGKVQVTFYKTGAYFDELLKENAQYSIGDRICQLIILPYPQINLIPVKKLQNSERGVKGHGSTGK